MESPQSTKDLPNAALSGVDLRPRISDENVHSYRCISPRTTGGTLLSREVNEALIKGKSPRNVEDSTNCTPLRVFRLKRQSLHSTDLNSNPPGAVKTPATNGKKTPVRVPINPFDAVLIDRLHLPICSPSIFTKIPDCEEQEFKWNIEEQATLFPVPIEEELHINHHMNEHYDAELESKLQEAIDRFYEGRVIAPSPWIEAKKCGLVRGFSDFAPKDASVLSPRTQKLGNILHNESHCPPTTKDACTQTQLSLPLNLPAELMWALQKYILPHDGDSGSASSSMLGVESESFSTSTRRKLFNVEDMSISQAESTNACSLKSPTCNSSLLRRAVSSSPVKGGTIIADFDCGESMDDNEIHSGVLESSKTTFWKATSSPDVSPIASQRLPPYHQYSPQDETRMKSKYDDLQSQYTPPSSRTRQRPFFPYSFAPLLEKDEDRLNEEDRNEKDENGGKASSGNKNQVQDDNSSSKEACNMGESRPDNGFSSSYSLQNVITQTQKVGSMSVSQYQQQVSQVTYERFDSMRVDDPGFSRMQDTGYQTVSMTTLPGSSVSSNSLRLKSGSVMPTDSVSVSDKILSCPVKINEDGYTSLSFNKIPAMSIYNDESMTDWHSSPPPLASSTPAKNFGGFLM